MRWRTYLYANKEVFNTELYLIGEAVEIALKNRRVGCEASRQQAEPRWTRIYI